MLFTKTDRETLNQIFNHLLTMRTDDRVETKDLTKICDVMKIIVENQKNLHESFAFLREAVADIKEAMNRPWVDIPYHTPTAIEKPKKKAGRPKKAKTPDQ